MMDQLPDNVDVVREWQWEAFAPYYTALLAHELTPDNVGAWLSDWTAVDSLLSELHARLRVELDQDTTSEEAEKRYFRFIEEIIPQVEPTLQAMKQKLLGSGEEILAAVEAVGMGVPLRNLREEAALFREENIPLAVELDKLTSRYQKIIGNQTVTWKGETYTLPQLKPLMNEAGREEREEIWRLAQERRQEDREALNALWQEMLPLRLQMAANADCADFREYMWRAYQRFDYVPDDARTFHEAILQVATPAATRIYERRGKALGVDSVRPWDLSDGEWGSPVSPPDAPKLKPFESEQELMEKGVALFNQVDAELGADFETMVNEALLDLENRPGKAPGGYCTYFALSKRPFIFMNAVGLHDDVQTLMHEAGHAFHAFASSKLPYGAQRNIPMEFNEVASMAMELLAAPYLSGQNGDAYYQAQDAARARLEHLEEMILFWPYMAVVDAFQHWVYTHPDEALSPEACDEQWATLWERYLPGVNWSGLDEIAETGWHRKVHIFEVPFYYVEYGIAALGAAQVWLKAADDQAGALAGYRQALALGGTATLPQLYETAGARFAFDVDTLRSVVSHIETNIDRLLAVIGEG